jgi:hypothetical protein
MNTLELANALELSDKHPELINVNNRAAAELRRLHLVNADLLDTLKMAVSALERSDYIQMDGDSFDVVDVSRAAIAKAEAP